MLCTNIRYNWQAHGSSSSEIKIHCDFFYIETIPILGVSSNSSSICLWPTMRSAERSYILFLKYWNDFAPSCFTWRWTKIYNECEWQTWVTYFSFIFFLVFWIPRIWETFENQFMYTKVLFIKKNWNRHQFHD